MAANYSSCILKAFGECGPYLPKREVDLVKFHSLNDDITTDIGSLRIKTTHQHVVSTSLTYHLVKIYENHYQSLDYKPLSTSSLLRVLEQCKFSQRRQITGLDNYTGDGMEGFQILESVLDKIGIDVEEQKHF